MLKDSSNLAAVEEGLQLSAWLVVIRCFVFLFSSREQQILLERARRRLVRHLSRWHHWQRFATWNDLVEPSLTIKKRKSRLEVEVNEGLAREEAILSSRVRSCRFKVDENETSMRRVEASASKQASHFPLSKIATSRARASHPCRIYCPLPMVIPSCP